MVKFSNFLKLDLPTSNSIFSASKWPKCKISMYIRSRISWIFLNWWLIIALFLNVSYYFWATLYLSFKIMVRWWVFNSIHKKIRQEHISHIWQAGWQVQGSPLPPVWLAVSSVSAASTGQHRHGGSGGERGGAHIQMSNLDNVNY